MSARVERPPRSTLPTALSSPSWCGCVAPFEVHQIVVDRLRARIEDQIVDHRRVDAALEQRRALVIVGVDVAVDEDAGGVVVDQRALGVLALGMAGVGEPLGEEIVGEGDVVAGAAPPVRRRRAGEARARGGEILVQRPGHRAMVDDHVVGADRREARPLPSRCAAPGRRRRCGCGCGGRRRRGCGCRCRRGSG